MGVITDTTLVMQKGVSYSKLVQFSTVPSSYIPATWTKMYFTVKEHFDDTDALSILQIVVSNPGVAADGILYLDKTAATALIQAYGSLAVNQVTGTVTITISDNGMLLMPVGRYAYDIKCLTSGWV